MPIYGEGECLYGLSKVCRLGDKGIEVDPIYCLNCVLLRLGDIFEEVTALLVIPEKDNSLTESDLH